MIYLFLWTVFLQEDYDWGLEYLEPVLQDMIDSITGLIIDIFVGVTSFFWDFLVDVLAGHYISDNPGVFLVGLVFVLTIYVVWRAK